MKKVQLLDGEPTGVETIEYRRDNWRERFRFRVESGYLRDIKEVGNGLGLPAGFYPVRIIPRPDCGVGVTEVEYWIWYLWPFTKLLSFFK